MNSVNSNNLRSTASCYKGIARLENLSLLQKLNYFRMYYTKIQYMNFELLKLNPDTS